MGRLETAPSLRVAPVALAPRAPTVPGGFRSPTFKSNFSVNTAANFLVKSAPKFESRTPNIANIRFSGPFSEFKKPVFSPREIKPQVKVWNPFNVPTKAETLSRRVTTLNGASGGRAETQVSRQVSSKMIWIGGSKEGATKSFIRPDVVIRPHESKSEIELTPPKAGRGSTAEIIHRASPQSLKNEARIVKSEDIIIFERVSRILEKGNSVKIIKPSLEKPKIVSKKERANSNAAQSLVEQASLISVRKSLILERLKRSLEKTQENQSVVKSKSVINTQVKAEAVTKVQQQLDEEIQEQTKPKETPKAASKVETKPVEEIVEFVLPKEQQKLAVKVEVKSKTQLEETVEALSNTGASPEVVAQAIVESLTSQQADTVFKSELITKVQMVLEEYEVVKQQTQKHLEEQISKEIKSELGKTYLVQDKNAQSERYGVVAKVLSWMRSKDLIKDGQVEGAVLAKNLPEQNFTPEVISGLVKNTPVRDGSWEYAKAEFSESTFNEGEASEVIVKVLEGNSPVVHSKDPNESRLAKTEEVKKVLNGYDTPRILVEVERIIEIRQKKLREVVTTIQEQLPQLATQIAPQLETTG